MIRLHSVCHASQGTSGVLERIRAPKTGKWAAGMQFAVPGNMLGSGGDAKQGNAMVCERRRCPVL
jgi:hypothetical protein